jgi:hypothetical protein
VNDEIRRSPLTADQAVLSIRVTRFWGDLIGYAVADALTILGDVSATSISPPHFVTPPPVVQAVNVVAARSVPGSCPAHVRLRPRGWLYASVIGQMVMMVVSLVVDMRTLGLGLLVTWPLCVILTTLAANRPNTRLTAQGAAASGAQCASAQLHRASSRAHARDAFRALCRRTCVRRNRPERTARATDYRTATLHLAMCS